LVRQHSCVRAWFSGHFHLGQVVAQQQTKKPKKALIDSVAIDVWKMWWCITRVGVTHFLALVD